MTLANRRRFAPQLGFTLIEAIVVMVITGILSGIMVLFIRQPVQNYADAVGRADLTDTADLALRRMARELHAALPNSIRISVQGGMTLLEFIPTIAGGQYVAVEDSVGGTPLSFTDNTALSFTVAGPMPAAPYPISVGNFIVVYNLGPGFQDADAYAGSNRATVSALNGTLVSMAANPFAAPFLAGRVPNTSPGHRFQVAKAPVTFRCDNDAQGKGTLRRYANYGFQAAQPTPATTPALLANNVLACSFTVDQPANQRSALIVLTIALARPRLGAAVNNLETLTLSEQIHVDNAP
jgi:MSHA biogenesis protein MshO